MFGEQIRLQVSPKLFVVNSWMQQTIRQWIPDCWLVALCHQDGLNAPCISLAVLAQISGDRGSLFLVRGTRDNKYLVSKLFDVTEESNLEDTLHTEENNITVAFGSGIVGTVALTKTPINIKDAYQVTHESCLFVLSLHFGTRKRGNCECIATWGH